MNNHMRRIYRDLLSQLLEKKLKPGDLLPTEKEFAEKYSTTRMNVYRVFKILISHNLLSSRKKAGTVVVAAPDLELASFLMDESSRLIYVLYSQTPHHIHWDNTSFAALESFVGKKNYTVYYKHIPTERSRTDFKQILDSGAASGIAALVIFPDSEDVTFLDENNDLLIDLKIPVFILNRGNNIGKLDFVSSISLDNFGDGIILGKLLRQNEYRHIIILGGPCVRDFWYIRRIEGIRVGVKSSLPDKKIESEEINILDSEKHGYVLSMIEKDRKDKKLAFVAVNSLFAAKFMDFCSSHGLRPVHDYDLLSFDDNPLYRSYDITCMAVRVREIGEIFGKMICDTGWFKEYQGRISVRLLSRLIIRSSCRPLKVEKSVL